MKKKLGVTPHAKYILIQYLYSNSTKPEFDIQHIPSSGLRIINQANPKKKR